MASQKWDTSKIIEYIRKRHRAGKDISYCATARENQALVSAANYYLGSYRQAVKRAGIDYSALMHKPRWNHLRVVNAIKQAKKQGIDLSWRAVSLRADEISRAAIAAVRPRLFGSWNEALLAAGLKPETVSRYLHWSREDILKCLAKRKRDGKAINSGAVQREVPGLYGAAVRMFKTWDEALRAAKIDPERVRQRREWTRQRVVEELVAFYAKHGQIKHTLLRKHDAGLGRAARLAIGPIKKIRQVVENQSGKGSGRRSTRKAV